MMALAHLYPKKYPMNRGVPQGQIGADVCFCLQQLVLREHQKANRTTYVDDINDVITATSSKEAINIAEENENLLIEQVKAIGFKLNADKTAYINFNIEKDLLLDKKPIEKEDLKILGFCFCFEPTQKGISVESAVNVIIKRLNSSSRVVHSSRLYTKCINIRVKIARAMIFRSIGELFLIKAYAKSPKWFEKIKVKVNDLLRGTGLRRDTPQWLLDRTLGTTLSDFADQGIIISGLKLYRDPADSFFDRTKKTRAQFPIGSFGAYFAKTWNNLPKKTRINILSEKSIYKIKKILKTERKLDFNARQHLKYKWVSFTLKK